MLIILLIWCCIGVVIINLLYIYLALSAKNWSCTSGKLISIKLITNSGPTKNIGGPIVSYSYYPKVKYAYSVGNKEYYGYRIRFDVTDKQFINKDEAFKSVPCVEEDGTFNNDDLKVYYNSFVPRISVLLPLDSSIDTNITFIILSVIIACILGYLRYYV